jgi:hypothetical protein
MSAAAGRLYVTRSDGLQVVDTTQPDAPRLAGRVPIEPQPVQVAARGSTAYVVDAFGWLHVVDATDTRQPREVDMIYLPEGAPVAALAQGDTLFLVGNPGVRWFDLTQPQHPVERGWWPAPARQPLRRAALDADGTLVVDTDSEGLLFLRRAPGPPTTPAATASGEPSRTATPRLTPSPSPSATASPTVRRTAAPPRLYLPCARRAAGGL